jgi:ABC-type nickel/cobalt efflux system permease component RcnA
MIRDAPTMTLAPRLARRRLRLGAAPRATLVAAAALVGILGALLVPAFASAHPLGNFTINHYTGIRVEPGRILLDVVIDQAEIPTFQARLDFDTDGDGEVSDAETEVGRVTACNGLAPSLALALDGTPLTLTLIEAGLTFPPGVGGLSTMRMVCGFVATPSAPLAARSHITYADTFAEDRLGWREIVVTGSGMTLAGSDGDLRATSTSARLTAYPTNLLTQALQDKQASFTASPGGPTLAAIDIPDATPLTGSTEVPITSARPTPGPGAGVAATTPPSSASGSTAAVVGNVPGGVGSGELPSIFRTADLTPVVLLISILTAAALGAGHAVTPGHGKTLMAAYLVGTRGTPLHAAGLGLSVTLSHTLGILVLAGLVVGAQGVLPPDVVVKWAPVVAAFSIVAIGGWMLLSEARRRWRLRASAAADERAHTRAHAEAPAHDHPHSHDHDHGHDHGHGEAHDTIDPAPVGEHSHGGVRHTHLPAAGSTISWRSLFVLGLAGGLIPSTSALLILLGSIAAGRPAFGFVLVVAFGLGMALVMGGIGLALVLARGRLDRVDSTSRLGRVSGYVPLAAAFVVFGFGLYLTLQAISGNATF